MYVEASNTHTLRLNRLGFVETLIAVTFQRASVQTGSTKRTVHEKTTI